MAKKTKSFAGVVKPITPPPPSAPKDEKKTDPSTPTERGERTAPPNTLQLSKEEAEAYEVVIFNDEQRNRREDYDRRITAGLDAFIDVATALIGLQEEKLYKETHSTFEAYCEEKYNLGRRRAYQLMEAGKAVLSLTTGEDEPLEVAPTRPFHAMALAEVEPGHRREVWDAVVSDSKETGKKITAKAIEKTNERLTGKAPKVKAGKPPKKKGPASESGDEFSDEQNPISSSALTRGLGNYKPSTDVSNDGEASPDNVDLDQGGDRDDDGAALPLSSFSRSDESDQGTGSDEDYNVDTDDENTEQRADQLTAVRDAIRQAGDQEILLVVKGSFLQRTGLSRAWASLRDLTDPTLIDEDFEDVLSLEKARSLGVI